MLLPAKINGKKRKPTLLAFISDQQLEEFWMHLRKIRMGTYDHRIGVITGGCWERRELGEVRPWEDSVRTNFIVKAPGIPVLLSSAG